MFSRKMFFFFFVVLHCGMRNQCTDWRVQAENWKQKKYTILSYLHCHHFLHLRLAHGLQSKVPVTVVHFLNPRDLILQLHYWETHTHTSLNKEVEVLPKFSNTLNIRIKCELFVQNTYLYFTKNNLNSKEIRIFDVLWILTGIFITSKY